MSPSSKVPKKPAVALSKVPSVKELCERLGFQRASLKDTNAFMDATHTWRKSYRTSGGTPGTELLLWNQLPVQSDLTIMAERFLEDRKNGDRFWSPARDWNHDSDVQYPEDRAKIIDLLKQLFWKQNRYAANNNAYAHKVNESRDASHDKTTPVNPTVPSPKNQHQARWDAALEPEDSPSWSPGFPSFGDGQARKDPAIETLSRSHVTRQGEHGLRPSIEVDIFEVPDDDDVNATITSPESSTQVPKRPRTQRTVPSRDVKPRKKKQYGVGESPRRTDRKAVRRSEPGMISYVSDDVYDQILKTPPRPDRQTPPLQQGCDQERPKGLLGNPNDIRETSPEHLLMAKAYSLPSPSSTAFVAPTAPMTVSNGFEESEDQVCDLSKSSQGNSPLEPRKAQTSPSNAQNQPSKVVRLQLKGRQISPPELLSEARSDSAQIDPQPQSQQIPPALTRGNNPQLRKTSSRPPPPTDQADQNFLDSAIGLHASIATTASKSGGTNKVFRPSVTPQPVHGVKRSTPSNRDTPNPLSSDKRMKKSETADIEKDERSQGHLQPSHSHQAGRGSSADNASSKPRSKTQVPLWIITREPRYTEERWDDGKFQGTKLSDFLKDLSKVTQRNHIEKVKLTLRTPTFDTKITVLKDAEDSWISAKARFVDKLKEARAEAKANRPNETANFEILVEPFYEEGVMMTSNADVDDEEFDF